MATGEKLVGKTVSETIDNVASALFTGARHSEAERKSAARAIADTQGKPGAYAGMFALSPPERARGFVVLTGERMTSASARHIAAEEALRVLLLLGVRDARVEQAIAAANASMLRVLGETEPGGKPLGKYCCSKCSIAFLRTVEAGGFDQREARLADGAERLRARRDGAGGWHGFPYFYTLLALLELPQGQRELAYAAPLIERKLRRRGSGAYAERRRLVLERALALA